MNNRIRILFLFIVILLITAIPTFSIDFGEPSTGKIYLPKENVILRNNQILIGGGSHWLPLTHLSADEKGLYIEKGNTNSALFQWECPRCGFDNWFWDDSCWVCGYKR